ncbi:MAG: phage tail length tape measure family protein, partial [Planctomycetaceae bacterium]
MKLPSLVVDILGNNRGFKQALGDSRNEARGFGSDLTSMLKAGAGAAAAAVTVAAAVAASAAAVSSYKEANFAMVGLEATLSASGNTSRVTAREIKSLAGELADFTNYGDDATIAAAKMLTGFDSISGDIFKETLKSGQDLAAFTGKDLTEAMELYGRALDDPTKGIALLRKQNITFSAEQKKNIAELQASGDIVGAQMALLDAVDSKIGGLAGKMSDPFVQMQNAGGDLMEALGGMLAPAVDEVALALTELIKEATPTEQTMKDMGETIKDVASIAVGTVKAVTWLIETINDLTGNEEELSHEIQQVGLNADGSVGKVNLMAEAQVELGDAAAEASKKLSQQDKAIVEYSDRLPGVIAGLEKHAKRMAALSPEGRKNAEAGGWLNN